MARQTKDIFDALVADHDRHRLLLKKLGKEDAAPEDRMALFEEFTRELKGHAAAEEQALYSVILAKPDTTDKARHSVAEHKEIEDMLNHLATVDVSSGEWMEKFEDLRDEYIHHIDEEEEEMFPAAEDELPDEKKKELLAIFEKEKPREKAKAAAEEPSSEDERE